MQFLWDEEKTRKLFKSHLILFWVGATLASVYAFLLPHNLPYYPVIVAVPVIFVLTCPIYYFLLPKENPGIRFLIFTLQSQLATSIFMAVTGGFLGIVQFAPYMLLLFAVFELGPAATVVLGIFALISFALVLIWSLTQPSYANVLQNSLYYVGSYILILIIERNIGHEISLQFEARKRLEAVDDLKNQFITLTSHYLRTPLTSIKAYLEGLLQTPLAPSQQSDLNKISLAASQLETLTEELLTISSIDRGQAKIAPRTGDLNQFLLTIVSGFKDLALNSQVELKYQPPPQTLPPINFDPEMLRKSISEIVQNAIKYNKVAGFVYVSLSQDTKSATITVEDSGVGIDPEHLKNLFSPFNRGSMNQALTTGGSNGGIGLGLYISKLIIEAHGGTIQVVSTLGKGSTFKVTLPLHH